MRPRRFVNNSRLPTLRAKVCNARKDRQDELDLLPKSLEENPQAELWSLCMKFIKDVDEFTIGKTQGTVQDKSFLQLCFPLYHNLQEAISRTRPKFQVVPCTDDCSDDACDEDGSAYLRVLLSNDVEVLLDAVREMIRTAKQRELPGITPFQVHEHYISQFVQKWESLCLNVFRQVEIILKDQVASICDKIFGRFVTSGLHYDVRYTPIPWSVMLIGQRRLL